MKHLDEIKFYTDTSGVFDIKSPVSERDAKYFIIGAPLDFTSIGRRGVDKAPNLLREALLQIETYNYIFDKDLYEVPFHDLGDLIISTNLKNDLEKLERITFLILDDNRIPVIIGGEHLVALPIIRALKKKYEKVGLIVLDSHLDLRDEYPEGSRYTHATVLRRISELINPENIYIIGAHAFSREEIKYAQKRGIHILETSKLTDYLKRDFKLDFDPPNIPCHLSIDIDVLDPSIIPGVSYPEPGGLSFGALLKVLHRLIKKCNIVSLDLVELCGPCDPTGISSFYAAKILSYILITHWVEKRG
ncbi:MAG TPA: agmatinase [Thermofilum sp.]|nr:agmatinase [Thermofilum sp.]